MTDIQAFLAQHLLPETFISHAEKWFDPLIQTCLEQKDTLRDATTHDASKPFFLGISGCQGSGKSTLTDYCKFRLSEHFGLNVASCSLDDFYLTKQARENLAKSVHPLLKTRGVPGTHDIDLANQCFTALCKSETGNVSLPTFDKLADDRARETNDFSTPVDIIIFEGWCLGATAQTEQSLIDPINELERAHDANGKWRRHANHHLAHDYAKLFDWIDFWVMLKAPSFDSVLSWRTEQEEKLAQQTKARGDSGKKPMSREAILQFIQHYQRITEHMLTTLPEKADVVFELDHQRKIQSVIHNH